MNNRQFPDVAGALTWNLVAKTSYQATEINAREYVPISPKSFAISNSYLVLIGLESQSKKITWRTGGWATQQFSFPIDSTTGIGANVSGKRQRIGLGSPKLCEFDKLAPTWNLMLEFPYWMLDISIEIWLYDGDDIDVFHRLNQIEAKL